MKKLFFLLGFVICLSFTSSAQTFLESNDAIEAMKKAISSGQNAVSLTDVVNPEQADARMVSLLKTTALRGYVTVVAESGNSQENLDALFAAAPYSNSDRIKEEVVAEVKSYVLGLVTK